jgi:hypothetical protein
VLEKTFASKTAQSLLTQCPFRQRLNPECVNIIQDQKKGGFCQKALLYRQERS